MVWEAMELVVEELLAARVVEEAVVVEGLVEVEVVVEEGAFVAGVDDVVMVWAGTVVVVVAVECCVGVADSVEAVHAAVGVALEEHYYYYLLIQLLLHLVHRLECIEVVPVDVAFVFHPPIQVQ